MAATERLKELDAGIEADMMEWLGRHRLRRHADTITRAAGPCVQIRRLDTPDALTLQHIARRDAAPSDLQYLTEENIAEIGAHVDRRPRTGTHAEPATCQQGVR